MALTYTIADSVLFLFATPIPGREGEFGQHRIYGLAKRERRAGLAIGAATQAANENFLKFSTGGRLFGCDERAGLGYQAIIPTRTLPVSIPRRP
jgi:hypothetical protein